MQSSVDTCKSPSPWSSNTHSEPHFEQLWSVISRVWLVMIFHMDRDVGQFRTRYGKKHDALFKETTRIEVDTLIVAL
jgi:hypothetical protein